MQRVADDLSKLILGFMATMPLEFHMTLEQKTTLFQAGYQTTWDYLPIKLARLRNE